MTQQPAGTLPREDGRMRDVLAAIAGPLLALGAAGGVSWAALLALHLLERVAVP